MESSKGSIGPQLRWRKLYPAGVDFATGGHTGHTSDKRIGKRHGLPGKTLKIRGVDPIATIRTEHVAIKRIEHYHHSFHVISNLVAPIKPCLWSAKFFGKSSYIYQDLILGK